MPNLLDTSGNTDCTVTMHSIIESLNNFPRELDNEAKNISDKRSYWLFLPFANRALRTLAIVFAETLGCDSILLTYA